MLHLGKVGPTRTSTILRSSRSQHPFGKMTPILCSPSRCSAGRLSCARSSFLRSLALRMKRVKIIAVYTCRSSVVSVRRPLSSDHRMCTYFIQYVFSLESGLKYILFLSFSTSSVPYVKSNRGVTISVVKSGDRRRSRLSFSDQSLQSIFVNDDPKPDFKDKHSPSNTIISSSESVESLQDSVSEAKQGQSALPAGTMPAVPSATVPPHLPCMSKSTFRAYPSFDAV